MISTIGFDRIWFNSIQFFLFTVSSNWDCKAINLASFSILSSCEAFRIGWSSVDGWRQKSKESKSGQNVQTFYKCKLGNTIRIFRIEQLIAHFFYSIQKTTTPWKSWPKKIKIKPSLKSPWADQYLLTESSSKWDQWQLKTVLCTGKYLSEAHILASINPLYDNRLFIELQEKYKFSSKYSLF